MLIQKKVVPLQCQNNAFFNQKLSEHMSFPKTVKRIGLAYVIMLCTFIVCIINVHIIPQKKIVDNIQESSRIISKEGAYHNSTNCKYLMRDNFTDALMINIAMTADDQHPVTSAINANYTGTGRMDMPECLAKVAFGETSEMPISIYARYWHGYQIFLRPLLTILNINGIRILNCVCFAMLFVILVYYLYKKTDIGMSIILPLSIYVFIIPSVPFSMQFSACFYIGILSCITILICPDTIRKEINLSTTFFCIGGLTSFFDLLTTPVITLGLPLIVANILYGKNSMKRLFFGCASWGLGYSMLWVSKWIVSYLLTGFNSISDAMEAAKFRISNNVSIDTYFSIPSNVFRIILLCIVIMLWLCLFIIHKKKHKNKEYDWLWAMTLLFPTWVIVLFNHSFLHDWFTWRSLSVSLAAILIYLYSISKKKTDENSSSDSML